mgnify:CR=1 FL=1
MQEVKTKKLQVKTFPLELEEGLHKSLKVKAIEEGKTLHSLIIDVLASLVTSTSAASDSKKGKASHSK